MSLIDGAWAWITDHATVLATVVSAFAAIAIAWFTVRLSYATDRLWNVSDRQARIAERALTDLERPYIYVFGAYKLEEGGTFEPVVKYTVANYGKTPAVIESVTVGIGATDQGFPTDDLRVEGTHWLLRAPIFAPSERRDGIEQALPANMDFDDPSENEFVPKIEDGADFFLRVSILYRGPFTTGHETSACWILDGNTNRFIQHGGNEYNYEK